MTGLLDAVDETHENNDEQIVSPSGTGDGEIEQALPDEAEEAMVSDEVGINNAEWEIAQTEDQASQLEAAADELQDVQATLEAMDGRLDIPDFMQQHVYQHYVRVCERLGAQAPVASVEDYGSNPMGNVVFRDSLESSIKEVAQNIWVAIIKAIEKMQELGQRLWNYLTDYSKRLQKKAEQVSENLTGEMAPGATFNANAYSDICWPEGDHLVFNERTLRQTGNWLTSMHKTIREDVSESQGLAENLLDITRNAKAARMDVDGALYALIKKSFIGEAIKRQWGVSLDGAIDNRTVLFKSKDSIMPGGYGMFVRADVMENAIGRDDVEKVLTTLSFYEKSVVNSKKIKEVSADVVEKKHLDDTLSAVIVICGEIHKHRSDIKKRQETASALKKQINALQVYLEVNRDRRAGKLPGGFSRWRSKRIVGMVRGIINALYRRADIYSTRAMKVSRVVVKLAEAFSYSEQRESKSTDSADAVAPPKALPA